MNRLLLGLGAAALAGVAAVFQGPIRHRFSKPGWHVDYTSPTEAHVWPCRDEQDHIYDENCPCGIQTIPIEQEGGGFGWVYKHTAYDGRE